MNKRIFIVADDQTAMLCFYGIFRNHYVVVEPIAHNGENALEALKRGTNADLILVCIEHNDEPAEMDGFEFVRLAHMQGLCPDALYVVVSVDELSLARQQLIDELGGVTCLPTRSLSIIRETVESLLSPSSR